MEEEVSLASEVQIALQQLSLLQALVFFLSQFNKFCSVLLSGVNFNCHTAVV